jgi:hypothetical protein
LSQIAKRLNATLPDTVTTCASMDKEQKRDIE